MPATSPVGKYSMGSGEVAEITDSDDAIVFHLNAAVGLFNHHDGVAGTAKQHVTYDYVQRIDKAMSTGESRAAEIVRKMAVGTGSFIPQLSVCRQANESLCEVTQSLKAVGDTGVVVVYNALGRSLTQHMTVLLSKEAVSIGVSVAAISGAGKSNPVYAEIVPNPPSDNDLAAPFTLHFTAENVPALATTVFEVRVQPHPLSSLSAKLLKPEMWARNDVLSISNEEVTIDFDRVSGVMKSARRKSNNEEISIDLSNDMGYYTSFGSPGQPGCKHPRKDTRDHVSKHLNPAHHRGEVSVQNSGAYVFRPMEANQSAIPIRCTNKERLETLQSVTVFHGREVSEVRQIFSSWASTTISLFRNNPGINLEYSVGPIPIDDDVGKEVIYKLRSSIDSDAEFYTDSNGREFMQRVRNEQDYDSNVYEPVAGNYYPISTAAYILDKNTGVQLSVITDRSLGGTSLESGYLL